MASATDLFARASNGTRPTPTTLTAILASGSGPLTGTCAALTGWPTTSKVHFCIYTINTSGAKVAGSQTDWVGVVSGSTITGMTLKAGTNTGYSVGAVVEASPIAAYADDLFSGLTAQHSAVDGSHTTITATSLSVSGATALTGALTLSSWDGWITDTRTWTYVSASSFKVSGVDVTTQFPVGTKIKLTQTTAKYFYVTSTSFSTDTTVNITAGTDYTLANAVITSPTYSYQATPQGFPTWFNYTPTWALSDAASTTIGNGTNQGKFHLNGKLCTVKFSFVIGTTTNAGSSGQWGFSAPITPVALTAQLLAIGSAYLEDNAIFGYPSQLILNRSNLANIGSMISPYCLNASSTYGFSVGVSSTTPFTWGNTDFWTGTGQYEVA